MVSSWRCLPVLTSSTQRARTRLRKRKANRAQSKPAGRHTRSRLVFLSSIHYEETNNEEENQTEHKVSLPGGTLAPIKSFDKPLDTEKPTSKKKTKQSTKPACREAYPLTAVFYVIDPLRRNQQRRRKPNRPQSQPAGRHTRSNQVFLYTPGHRESHLKK